MTTPTSEGRRAEFLRSPSNRLPVVCTLCGALVPVELAEVHADWHGTLEDSLLHPAVLMIPAEVMNRPHDEELAGQIAGLMTRPAHHLQTVLGGRPVADVRLPGDEPASSLAPRGEHHEVIMARERPPLSEHWVNGGGWIGKGAEARYERPVSLAPTEFDASHPHLSRRPVVPPGGLPAREMDIDPSRPATGALSDHVELAEAEKILHSDGAEMRRVPLDSYDERDLDEIRAEADRRRLARREVAPEQTYEYVEAERLRLAGENVRLRSQLAEAKAGFSGAIDSLQVSRAEAGRERLRAEMAEKVLDTATEHENGVCGNYRMDEQRYALWRDWRSSQGT